MAHGGSVLNLFKSTRELQQDKAIVNKHKQRLGQGLSHMMIKALLIGATARKETWVGEERNHNPITIHIREQNQLDSDFHT